MSLKKRANLITAILFSSALPPASHAADNADAIRNFQQSLIKNEITGSNVVMIFRDGKRVYH